MRIAKLNNFDILSRVRTVLRRDPNEALYNFKLGTGVYQIHSENCFGGGDVSPVAVRTRSKKISCDTKKTAQNSC